MSAEAPPEPRYLPVPATGCARQSDRIGWHTTVGVLAGDHVLGVRTNTQQGADVVRALFPERLVPDAEPPANLSMYIAPEVGQGPRELHRLYVNGVLIHRSREAEQILRALWHELDMRDVHSTGDRLLVEASVVVRGDEAHLLPALLRSRISARQRRLDSYGFTLLDRRWLSIDLATGTIERPILRGPAGDGPSSVEVEELSRVPISSWTPSLDAVGPSRGLLLAVMQLILRAGQLTVGDIERVRDLLELPEPTLNEDPAAGTLTALLRSRRAG